MPTTFGRISTPRSTWRLYSGCCKGQSARDSRRFGRLAPRRVRSIAAAGQPMERMWLTWLLGGHIRAVLGSSVTRLMRAATSFLGATLHIERITRRLRGAARAGAMSSSPAGSALHIVERFVSRLSKTQRIAAADGAVQGTRLARCARLSHCYLSPRKIFALARTNSVRRTSPTSCAALRSRLSDC